MLEILIGKDWTNNTDKLMDMVACDVRQHKGNRLILVPELITHDTERMLCQVAGDTASRYAEVLSFSRLARRVADYTGSTIPACMDNGGRLVAMAAAARHLHGSLKAYAAVESKPEFLTMMVDAMDEFKRCCIQPLDLAKAASNCQGELAQKLEELSLLMEAYDAVCANGKRDPRDLMNWVLEEMNDSDFAQAHVVYMDAFPDLTRQHMAVLEHFIRYSPCVTVSLNCDCVGSRAMAYEKAGDTASQLMKLAKNAGVSYRITQVESREDSLLPMREHLFQGTLTDGVCKDQLHTYQAPSMHRECMAAAQQIRKLVKNGCRYRDVAIVCPQMDRYKSILSRALRTMEISYYLSGTDCVLNEPAVATVFAALEAALCGFEQKHVLRYLRGVISPLDADTCDLVENYALVWNVDGYAWRKSWENHPNGYTDSWHEGDRVTLRKVENARKKAIEPLEKLQRSFAGSQKLSQQVDGVYAFFNQIGLEKRLEQLAQEAMDVGDGRAAQVLNQLWEILLRALEQLSDVLGDTVWDDYAFLRLLSLIIGQYHVGTIPTVLDAVHVGPVSAMRCQRPRHLIVLGCEEGHLPGYSGSTGVFSDGERDTLRKLDVPLTGGALEGIQAEFAELYGVFCGAGETVSMYCCSAESSYVFQRMAKLSANGIEAVDVLDLPTNAYDAAGMLYRQKNLDLASKLGLQDSYQQVQQRCGYDLGKISRENIGNLYGSTVYLSASQVDSLASCQFNYFLKNGLKLQERKEAKISPLEFGLYVHDVLEKTVRDVMDKEGFHKISQEETIRIAKGHSDAYIKDHFDVIDSQRIMQQLERNWQELNVIVQMLWDELQISDYIPITQELYFGEEDGIEAISVNGDTIAAQVRGEVDRVDVFHIDDRSYFRVVDYKTGKRSFDYCDVFNGIGFQMLLYLYALEQGQYEQLKEGAIAAGVEYFFASAPYKETVRRISAVETGIKQTPRKGLLLNDDLSLAAMDPRDGKPTLGMKGDQTTSSGVSLASGEEMKLLKEYVFLVLRRLVDQIGSGDVSPNPYSRGSEFSICSYCPYSVVCHKDTVENKRNFKSMDRDRFWEEVRKELNADG